MPKVVVTGEMVESGRRRHVKRTSTQRRPRRLRVRDDDDDDDDDGDQKPQRKKHDEDQREKHMRMGTPVQDWRWLFKRHKEQTKAALLRKKVGVSKCEVEHTLPFHLIVQHILVRLPLRQLCQLRCVCKSWNAMLAWGGSVATMKIPQHEEEEYWFVMRSFGTPNRLFIVYSSHDRPLFLLPLLSDKLLSYLGGLHCSRLAITEEFACYQLIASAGGLMCALVHAEDDGYDVVVFNCLTGSVKVLPPPLFPKKLFVYFPCLMYMAVDDQDPCRYYVMLTDTVLMVGWELSFFEVFDSRTGSWKVGGNTTSGLKMPSGDFFHFQYAYPDDMMKVLAYHAAEGAWSTVQVPFRPKRIHPHLHFHKYKGRLFQACFLEDDRKCMAFGVWELQFTSSENATLVEVSRTPEHLGQLTRGATMILEAEGGLFYTRSYDEEGAMAPLVYDISQNSWYVQPLPLERGFEFLLVHRPRLGMFFC